MLESMTSGRRLAVVLLASALSGCSSEPEEEVPPCEQGEHLVGSACVPDVFDQVLVPPQPSGADVETAADGSLYMRGQLMVFLHDDAGSVSDASALVTRHGGRVLGVIPFGGFVLAKFDDALSEAALDEKRAALAADPAVKFVARDAILPASALAGDMRPDNDFEKLTAGQAAKNYYSGAAASLPADFRWPFERIGAPAAWSAIYDANVPLTPVTIAVIDGYVEHSALFGALDFGAAHDLRMLGDYSADTNNPKHGTAVAAVIGAPNDGQGTSGIVAGVPKKTGGSCVPYDLAPMAVAAQWSGDANRSGLPTDAIFFAHVLAVKNGARVVNVSLGGDYSKPELEDLRFYLARSLRLVCARAKKVLFVYGAANDGVDAAKYWPASVARQDEELKGPANAITVAAVGKDDRQAVWQTMPKLQASNFDGSNTGVVSLAAPGSDIVTHLPSGDLTQFIGTSAAAPMVSGSAALLFAIEPKLSGTDARGLLFAEAQLLPGAFPQGPPAPRIDIGRSVGTALQLVAENHGKGNCRQETPANVCRVLLDPNAADPFGHFIMLEYDIAASGMSGTESVMANGHVRIWQACGPPGTVGSGFDFDILALNGGLGTASCKTFDISGSASCPMPDDRFAPGASYTLNMPPLDPKAECTVRCPEDLNDKTGIQVPITSGNLTVTFSEDCKSLKGTWKASTSGSCGYDVTFTGKFNKLL
jgi:subtilisin family serine protease